MRPDAAVMSPLTEVHLVNCTNRRYRLLFGVPFDVVSEDHPHPPGARIAFFRPGERFGLALWERNDEGKTHWRVLVCRTLRDREAGSRVPQVQPGAHVLLDVRGSTRAQAALQWLHRYVEAGDALSLPEAQLAEADFRLNDTPLVRLRAYTRAQP